MVVEDIIAFRIVRRPVHCETSNSPSAWVQWDVLHARSERRCAVTRDLEAKCKEHDKSCLYQLVHKSRILLVVVSTSWTKKKKCIFYVSTESSWVTADMSLRNENSINLEIIWSPLSVFYQMSSQIPLSLSLGRFQRPTRRFPLWVNPDFVLCNDPAFLVSFPRFIDERSGGVLAVEEGKRLFTTSSAKSCAQYQVLNLVDARCVIGRFDHEKFVDNQVANAHILSFSDVVMSGPKASCAYGDVVHSPARPLIFSTWPDLVNPARCMCFIAEPWSDTSIPTPSVLLHVGVVSWDDFLASHNCRKLKLNSLTLPIACLSEKTQMSTLAQTCKSITPNDTPLHCHALHSHVLSCFQFWGSSTTHLSCFLAFIASSSEFFHTHTHTIPFIHTSSELLLT